jgi:signal transduction histidine kinase
MMSQQLRSSGRALVGSFAAVALAFTVGLAGAQTFNFQIRSAVREITGNSSPSISYLSSMRSTLRQLEVAVGDHVMRCAGVASCGAPPARISQLRQELDAAWHEYRLLPTFPGETDIWPRAEADLNRLDEVLALTLEGTDARERLPARLRADVNPAFDRVDATIARMLQWDHEAGLAVAGRIDALTRLSTTAAIAIDVVAVGLTILAATLAMRVVRRYEGSLRDRAEDLEQFAGRVAHDVKGPLSATAAALHVARRSSTEAGSEAIRRGQRSLQRVQRLVDDLLEFSRAGVLDTRGVAAEVRDVVEDVVGELRPFAEDQRVELRVEDVARARIACSPGVLTSIVGNLVRNAIAHMGASELRVVRVRASPVNGDPAVRVEVEDTGPGIPGALGERVFEPFVRGPAADAGGTGLGLATVKRFVDAHGGRVGFQARSGGGTLFWLEMPSPDRPAQGGR